VVKVVSTWGNQKAKSGGMGRVFRLLIHHKLLGDWMGDRFVFLWGENVSWILHRNQIVSSFSSYFAPYGKRCDISEPPVTLFQPTKLLPTS
jgi:hypothetical protein